MHISTFSMHISTPTEQGAKFGVCDTPVMASVESSLLMADTTPCDSANENSANRRQLRKRQLPGTLNSAALTATEPTEPVGATTTPFMSAMAIDQEGEQMVKLWKSQGGPSNVTQKSAAMLEEI